MRGRVSRPYTKPPTPRDLTGSSSGSLAASISFDSCVDARGRSAVSALAQRWVRPSLIAGKSPAPRRRGLEPSRKQRLAGFDLARKNTDRLKINEQCEVPGPIGDVAEGDDGKARNLDQMRSLTRQ